MDFFFCSKLFIGFDVNPFCFLTRRFNLIIFVLCRLEAGGLRVDKLFGDLRFIMDYANPKMSHREMSTDNQEMHKIEKNWQNELMNFL